MNIPVANVIVGFNKDVMNSLFAEGATYKNLMKGLSEEEDALLFDNESNPSFISFEHTGNMGDGWKMKLVLIDPKGDLERRLFSDKLLPAIAGSAYTDSSEEGTLASKVTKDMASSQSLYNDKYFSELKEEFSKHIGINTFYIAYGTGNNLALWSGPHRCVLTGAHIEVKGPRKITLTFAPTATDLNFRRRRGDFNEQVNLNLAGLTLRHVGESNLINFSSGHGIYDPLNHLELDLYKDAVQNSREEGASTLESFNLRTLGSLDFHSLVVDTIRSYVQHATNNPNVIVLLPDLNIVCREKISNILKYGPYPDNRSSGFVERPESPLSQYQLAGEYEYVIQILLEDFGLRLGSPSSEIPTDKPVFFAERPLERPLTANFIERPEPTFHSLPSREEVELARLERFAGLPHERPPKLPRAIPSAKVNKYTSKEKAPSAEDRRKKYYEEGKFYGILESSTHDRRIPDHNEVLSKVFNAISKNSKGAYNFRLAIVNETNTKLLDYWTKGDGTINPSKFSTFGGYSKFNEAKEAVIVGDVAMIDNYLFGSLDLAPSYKSINKLRAQKSLAESDLEKTNLPTEFTSLLQADINETQLSLDKIVQKIPLHPLDKIIVGDVRYNKTVRDIVFPRREQLVGAFGDITELPDEFAYSDNLFSDEKKEYIKNEAIPVFRFNIQNPNVLSLNLTKSNIYLDQLRIGFSKGVTRKSSAVVEGVLPLGKGSLPITTRAAAIAYLKLNEFPKDRQKLIQDLMTRLSPELSAEVGAEKEADFIAMILDKLKDQTYKGYIEIDQVLPGNPNGIMADLMEDMYRKTYTVTMKTLPTFHLSNIVTHIGQPCILLAQDANITQSRKVEKTLMNTFYSGLYGIYGFKHTITSRSSQSEFRLVKIPTKGVSDEK
jgi:hypothetical protein